jgi:hypothetical protein
MSELWKLNMEDYNLNELKQLFELKDPHTLEDVVLAHQKVKDYILVDTSIGEKKRKEISSFLDEARDVLMKEGKNDMQQNATQIFTGDQPVIKSDFKLPGNDELTFDKLTTTTGKKHSTYTKVVCINSTFRKDYYKSSSTDFEINLPHKLNDVAKIELTSFQMPNTYYHLSKKKGNNYFWINITTNWYYINIPEGTYNRLELQDAINENICHAVGGTPPLCKIDKFTQRTIIAHSSDFSLHFNKTRGDYTTTTNGPTTEPPKDDCKNIAENFGWILGYRAAEYKDSNAYVSEGVFDSWGNKSAYLIVNDFNKNFTNTFETLYNKSLGRDNILARIPLKPITSSSNTETSLKISFHDGTGHAGSHSRTYYGPVDIEKLHISVVDDFGRIIDLHYMDLTFELTFTCLRN